MPVWFKPRSFGYGATPVTWEGWAIVVGFIIAVLITSWVLIGFDRNVQRPAGNIVAFLAVIAALSAALWIVCLKTTDGEWRWRWGNETNESENRK